jgi:hypothetical protein
MNFLEFCSSSENIDTQKIAVSKLAFSFTNRSGNEYLVDLSVAVEFIRKLNEEHINKRDTWNDDVGEAATLIAYNETKFRSIFKHFDNEQSLSVVVTLGGSQTKWLTAVLTKLICYLGGFKYEGIENNTRFDSNSIANAVSGLPADLSDLADAGSAHAAQMSRRDFEKSFRAWMRANGKLSEKSIDEYSRGAGRFINKCLAPSNPTFLGIFTVDKVVDLDVYVRQLEDIEEYVAAHTSGKGMYSAAISQYRNFLNWLNSTTVLPKPFVLLAGISGTGKTRYVREQASFQDVKLSNFLLIPVRPDWHEPSDLLGYVSRIDGEKYVPTPFLKFIVAAWRNALESTTPDEILLKPIEQISTYWACLDEMNLAPVEQYFADYLSVLETRVWTGPKYTCDALIRPAAMLQTDPALRELQTALGLDNDSALWAYFVKNGISLPPNLVVAGTINMDETTHGFSRKVIDRALTIDFGEFFPNNFDDYFLPSSKLKPMVFPQFSSVTEQDLSKVIADPDGKRSIEFLKQINGLLKGSAFELAYRALNELLISVKSFSPTNDIALFAVWDDFIMAKLLPRLEGDSEKLNLDGEDSLLTKMLKLLSPMMDPKLLRPDFYRTNFDGSEISVPFRSIKKIEWMQHRLIRDSFTSFWP